jgi:hypothetical protein
MKRRVAEISALLAFACALADTGYTQVPFAER